MISGTPVSKSCTTLLVTANAEALLVRASGVSMGSKLVRSCRETELLDKDTRMFASFIIASCSMARVENFSTSRRRSVGLCARSLGVDASVVFLGDVPLSSGCEEVGSLTWTADPETVATLESAPSESVTWPEDWEGCENSPFVGLSGGGGGGSSLTRYIRREPVLRPTRTRSP